MIYSPLEQFHIVPIITGFHYNLTLTNAGLIIIFTLCAFLSFQYFLLDISKAYIVPIRIQIFFESVYIIIVTIVEDNLGGHVISSWSKLEPTKSTIHIMQKEDDFI